MACHCLPSQVLLPRPAYATVLGMGQAHPLKVILVDADEVLGGAVCREAALSIRLRAEVNVWILGAVVAAGCAIHPRHRIAEVPCLYAERRAVNILVSTWLGPGLGQFARQMQSHVLDAPKAAITAPCLQGLLACPLDERCNFRVYVS